MSALKKTVRHSATILVVEDDGNLREALVDTLELENFNALQAESAERALDVLAHDNIDMVVSDVNMGAMDGHQLLNHIQRNYPYIPVLLITAYASVSRSVEAIRNGAVDYLVKPFEAEKLVALVKRHVVGVNVPSQQSEPIAEEESSKQLLQLARRVASTDSTVLISGESGTGKEVLARYVHAQSRRADGPFIAINCAAIPENMLEATLFGHEKGAFTGAYNSTPGKFEQANGGTILLDEISEMDIGLQAKLLRVLQEREVERVGGRKTVNLDVRVIATTNRKLLAEVADGKFREDLYYRLSVFPLEWKSLRNRRSDILPLARKLLLEHAKKMHRNGVVFDESAERALLAHHWPGNVRELDNVVQRALIMQPMPVISDVHLRIQPVPEMTVGCEASQTVSYINDIEPVIDSGDTLNGHEPASEMDSSLLHSDTSISTADLGDNLKRKEFSLILETLKGEQGSRKNTAEKLGISPRTLRYKLARMRESGIDIDAVISA